MKRNVLIMMLMVIVVFAFSLFDCANNNEIVESTKSETVYETTVSYEKTTESQETEPSIVVETTEPTKVVTEPTEIEQKSMDITYPIVYSDSSCKITIVKEWHYNAWCYIAHLEFSDYSRFGSVLAHDRRGAYETTSSVANRIGAIFCVNGCYNWGELKDAYAVVRSGVVFRDAGIHEDLCIYNSATGILKNAGQMGLSGRLASTVVAEGLVTDTFKFWDSTVVKNGQNIASNGGSRAQRTFIATNGNAGDIYVIVSEGRYVDGESVGLTLYECANVILELGCTYGVMLDGGGSSTMVWNGEVLNSAKNNERAVVDFVYFK